MKISGNNKNDNILKVKKNNSQQFGNMSNFSSSMAFSSSSSKGKNNNTKCGGNGKGRVGCKHLTLSSSKVSDSYAIMFPNALPVKQVVWAKDLNENAWKYAYIVHARRSDSLENIENYKLSAENYDYYIHFQGMDRRLDCWLSWENLRNIEVEPPPDELIIREIEVSDDEHAGMDEEYLREHEENTKVKNIDKVRMGNYLTDTWYFSPYPKDYQNIETLYLCEFCLSFFREESELNYHMARCQLRHPPGNEIYRDNDIAMYEVDGNHCRIYCENLCYLSKLYLDHKTLRHPVNLFLFYVMTEIDSSGYHVTGYFSKEKYSKNNVSCILTLPQHQRKGYGKFLINFSYSLSKKERKAGTPERPLSDLGKASYMAIWSEILLKILATHEGPISIQELSDMTCFETSDIITCLEEKGVLRYAPGGEYFFLLPPELLQVLIEKSGKPTRPISMQDIHWVSYDQFLAPYEYNPQA